jgi:hypothetical protein
VKSICTAFTCSLTQQKQSKNLLYKFAGYFSVKFCAFIVEGLKSPDFFNLKEQLYELYFNFVFSFGSQSNLPNGFRTKTKRPT